MWSFTVQYEYIAELVSKPSSGYSAARAPQGAIPVALPPLGTFTTQLASVTIETLSNIAI